MRGRLLGISLLLILIALGCDGDDSRSFNEVNFVVFNASGRDVSINRSMWLSSGAATTISGWDLESLHPWSDEQAWWVYPDRDSSKIDSKFVRVFPGGWCNVPRTPEAYVVLKPDRSIVMTNPALPFGPPASPQPEGFPITAERFYAPIP